MAAWRCSISTTSPARGRSRRSPATASTWAAGLGICLQAKRGMLTTYEALVFDRRFRVLHRLPLAGPPSRARLSADGRLAAVTVFLAGHSYAGASFTTRPAVLDTASGHWVVEDLEGFEVLREGRPMKAADFNFWGISFRARRAALLRHAAHRWPLPAGRGRAAGAPPARRSRGRGMPVAVAGTGDGSPTSGSASPARALATSAGKLQVLALDTGRETALTAEDAQRRRSGSSGSTTARCSMPGRTTRRRNDAGDAVWALAADNGAPPRRLLRHASSPAAMR
jgi:hypothetical protein